MISKKFAEGGHHSVSDYDDFTAEEVRIAELRGFVYNNGYTSDVRMYDTTFCICITGDTYLHEVSTD